MPLTFLPARAPPDVDSGMDWMRSLDQSVLRSCVCRSIFSLLDMNSVWRRRQKAGRYKSRAPTDTKGENEIQQAHLDFLHFFQPLQLTQSHVLRLDAASPHEQAVRGRRGRRRRLWGRWDGASAADGRSCRGGWLHDSLEHRQVMSDE